MLSNIVRRRCQSAFRKALLSAYESRCVVTGSPLVQVLEAARVCPCKNEETNLVTKGPLLRADVRTLFDLPLIAMHPASLRVLIAPCSAIAITLHFRALSLPPACKLARASVRLALNAVFHGASGAEGGDQVGIFRPALPEVDREDK